MHSIFPGLIRLLPLAALAVAQAAFAQGAKSYPDKPVRVVVGYSPGGLPDTIARVIGQKLSERWGQQFVALVKASPGKYSYGSSGIGSTHHLCMEYLKSSLNLQITHVPYKGTGQSVPALVGGQVPMVFSGYPTLASHAKDGRVKLLAINSLRRSELAPDVPAIAETIPGFDFAPTFGLFAPNGTPRDIIVKIGADVAQVVKLPDVIERMKNLGIDPLGVSGDQWARLLKSDAERYAKAAKISGAKVD